MTAPADSWHPAMTFRVKLPSVTQMPPTAPVGASPMAATVTGSPMASGFTPSAIAATVAPGVQPLDLVARTVAHVTTGNAPWAAASAPAASIPEEVAEVLALAGENTVGPRAIAALVTMQATETSTDLLRMIATWHSTGKGDLATIAAAVMALARFHEADPGCISVARIQEAYAALIPFASAEILVDLAEHILALGWPSLEAPLQQIVTRLAEYFLGTAKKVTSLPSAMGRIVRLLHRLNPSAGIEIVRRMDKQYPSGKVFTAQHWLELDCPDEAVALLQAVLQTDSTTDEEIHAHLRAFALIGEWNLAPQDFAPRIERLMDLLPGRYLVSGMTTLHKLGLLTDQDVDQYVEALRKDLRRWDNAVSLVCENIRALGAIHAVEAIPDLQALLHHEDGEVVATAALALYHLGDDAQSIITALRGQLMNQRGRFFIFHAFRELPIGEDLIPDLLPLLENPPSLHYCTDIAQVLIHLGRGDLALPTLRTALQASKTSDWEFVEGLEALATSYAQARKTNTNAEALQDIGRIRAACRQERVKTLTPAHGFDNRGRRQRRGAGAHGEIFDSLQEVHARDVTGRIDPAATERLGADRRAMGHVVERRTNATGSRAMMVVIDPTIFAGLEPRAIAALAGTVAERALQRGDPVGLLLGDLHLPPKDGPNQLRRLMHAITTYRGAQQTKTLPQQLEHKAIRRHLRPGTMTTLIGDFLTMAPDALTHMHRSFISRGVGWQAVAVRSEFPVPAANMQIGSTQWKIPSDRQEATRRSVEVTHLPKIAAALQSINAALVDLERVPPDEIPQAAVTALKEAERGKSSGELSAVIVGKMTYRHEQAEPADIHQRIAKAYGDEKAWADLLRAAIMNGWPSPMEYTQHLIQDALNRTGAPLEILELVAHFDNKHGDKGAPDPIIGHGPHCDQSGSAVARLEQLLARRRRFDWLPGRRRSERSSAPKPLEPISQSTGPRAATAISLTASGVAAPIRSGPTWMRCAPTPQGRARYFRTQLGTRLDGATVHPNTALSPNALEENGTRAIRANITRQAPTDPMHLQPVGGEFYSFDEGVLTIGTTNAPPQHPLLDESVATLRAQGATQYGQALYAELTDAPSWEALAGISVELANRWQALAEKIQGLPLREALALLQRMIAKESGLTYRSYADDRVAMALWRQFLQQAKEGNATLLDHLRLAVNMKGGKCMEFALLGLILLRRAGIPAALATGWVANRRGRVETTPHAWVEVVLPRDHGRWTDIPIEFSPPFTDGAWLSDWLNPSEGLSDDILQAVAAEPTTTEPRTKTTPKTARPRTAVGGSQPTAATAPTTMIDRDQARAILDRLLALWTTGTAEQRGQIDVAFAALEAWSDHPERPVWEGSPQTWEEYLGANLAGFITFSALPHQREADHNPRTQFSRTFGPTITRLAGTSHWNAWLTGVARYFSIR